MAVRRLEIRLELLPHLGRGRKICRADNDTLDVFGDFSFVSVLVLRLEKKIFVSVRFPLGGIAVAVDQFLARLDADERRLVVSLILLALEQPKFRYLCRIVRNYLVGVQDRIVVPPMPLLQLVALVCSDKDNMRHLGRNLLRLFRFSRVLSGCHLQVSFARFNARYLERILGKQKCVPCHSLSSGGLGVPMREREDKDTQDGINRLRDLAKLRSLI